MVSMDGDKLKELIPIWAAEKGHKKALMALIHAGVGYTTAVFLINGTYVSTPKATLIKKLLAVIKP